MPGLVAAASCAAAGMHAAPVEAHPPLLDKPQGVANGCLLSHHMQAALSRAGLAPAPSPSTRLHCLREPSARSRHAITDQPAAPAAAAAGPRLAACLVPNAQLQLQALTRLGAERGHVVPGLHAVPAAVGADPLPRPQLPPGRWPGSARGVEHGRPCEATSEQDLVMCAELWASWLCTLGCPAAGSSALTLHGRAWSAHCRAGAVSPGAQ